MWTPADVDRLLRHVQERLDLWEQVLRLGTGSDAGVDPSQAAASDPAGARFALARYAAYWQAVAARAREVPFAVCRDFSQLYPDLKDPATVMELEHQRLLAAEATSAEEPVRRTLMLCRYFLQRYEERYGCLSPTFYPRYVAGLWQGPAVDAAAWADLYHSFRALLGVLAQLRRSSA